MWPHQNLVLLRVAVGEAIDFVLAGDADHVLAPRLGRVDLGVQNFFSGSQRLGERFSSGIDDLAAADEVEFALRSDAVGRCAQYSRAISFNASTASASVDWAMRPWRSAGRPGSVGGDYGGQAVRNTASDQRRWWS